MSVDNFGKKKIIVFLFLTKKHRSIILLLQSITATWNSHDKYWNSHVFKYICTYMSCQCLKHSPCFILNSNCTHITITIHNNQHNTCRSSYQSEMINCPIIHPYTNFDLLFITFSSGKISHMKYTLLFVSFSRNR
jgi:hypothetical protein